jgi:hypothetical protein
VFNPTETAEYAPIPPQDNSNSSPPGGSLGSLGLGSSGSLSSDASQQQDQTLPGDLGNGDSGASSQGNIRNPVTSKRCVGRPPKQTEDPFSPPCVADFRGDNFGSTYTGVTGKEVTVLFYFNGGPRGCVSQLAEGQRPSDKYYDLGKPAPTNPNDPNYESAGTSSLYPEVLRTYQQYFNDRYQTYNRFVHFWVYFGHVGSQGSNGGDPTNTNGGCASADLRAQDAAANYEKLHPFAVVNFSHEEAEAYTEAMASKNVVVFKSVGESPNIGLQDRVFQKHKVNGAGLIWSFLPSMEEFTGMYTSFICQKVTPFNTSLLADNASGDVKNGIPRKLGMIRADDQAGHPELLEFAANVKKATDASQGGCGGKYVVPDSTYHPCCYDQATREDREKDRLTDMQKFQSAGVTTIIWPGGIEPLYSDAADKIGYHPEWILAGDRESDGNTDGGSQAAAEWNIHAWTVSSLNYRIANSQEYAYQAAASVDQNSADANGFLYLKVYEDVREMFVGIQVAGPSLTPASVDKGYHNIPHVISKDPRIPSCFYNTNEYTCIKDAVAEWYDTTAPDQNFDSSCWKMTARGGRFQMGRWPSGDIMTMRDKANDVCNSFQNT